MDQIKKLFSYAPDYKILVSSGVASAISAGFGAPIAGIIFAHETVLRHFSLRAITAIALSSMTANFAAIKIGIVTPPLLLEKIAFELSDVIYGLLIIGLLGSIIAIFFMKSMIYCSSLPKKMCLKNLRHRSYIFNHNIHDIDDKK